MSQLRALTPYYFDGSSINVVQGMFYRLDTTGGSISAYLPPSALCQPGDWMVIKNVGKNSGNSVTVYAYVDPASGYQEYIDGSTTQTISYGSGFGSGHTYFPGAPSGGDPDILDGWTSF